MLKMKNKLTKSGRLENIQIVEENLFMTPVVNTAKKDKSVKTAFFEKKLNGGCIVRKSFMRKIEKMLQQISTGKT